jgi:type I restriction enzyme R subunit
MERVKMVMTRGKDDPKALYDLLGNKEYRKELDRQFKKAEVQLQDRHRGRHVADRL